MRKTFKKKLMRHLGPTRPDCILHEKLHTMSRWHVVQIHISVRRRRVVGVFPYRRVGRGASSCTVANWQPSTDSSPRKGWVEVHFIACFFCGYFIACYLLCDENFSIYNVSSLSMWVDDLLYVIKWYACDKLTKFMNGFRVASVSEWCDEAKKIFSKYIIVRALQQVIGWGQSTIVVHYLY